MPKLVLYFAAALLIIGAFPLPYGYYQLMRIVACGVFCWAAYLTHEKEGMNGYLLWVFVLLAIIFNPIVPIHLSKEIWAGVDIGAAGILFVFRKRIIEKIGE